MALPRPTRFQLVLAGAALLGWIGFSLGAAYLTGNGWWFLAWWVVLVLIAAWLRATGALRPAGRHEADRRA